MAEQAHAPGGHGGGYALDRVALKRMAFTA